MARLLASEHDIIFEKHKLEALHQERTQSKAEELERLAHIERLNSLTLVQTDSITVSITTGKPKVQEVPASTADQMPSEAVITSPTPTIPPITPTEQSKEPSNKLSECVKEFLHFKEANQLHPKTLLRYQTSLQLAVLILGDKPIDSYKRPDALTLRDKMLRLPSNLQKIRKYRGKSIDEILAFNDKPRSVATANYALSDITGFFDWCVLNELTEKNVFLKIAAKQKVKASEQRKVFTDRDLSKLFDQPFYKGQKPYHKHYYWLPLLALYTGARMNELCQLYKNDIRETEGIWTITFTDEREDQRLKNKSSYRTIPIHSKLIKLGFIEYVQSIKSPRLFSELKLNRDGYQKEASRWFQRLRNTALPDAKEDGKTFHSFRHTVADCLKQQGISKSFTAAILGHSEENETYGRYGKDYLTTTLKPVIEKLSFELEVIPWQLV
ncbi:site-specific integrase [Vibrio sp. SCSIO 43137]|nr:site-specific integrase [Vibrio sp. SCSIO 43137]WCE28781.1 site-specific integrase [Vibrio sp. SCSIO 43137]